MTHYFESGFSVRTPMWHGLGNVLIDYPGSWDEARHPAGLDWEPIKVPTYEYRGIDGSGEVAHAWRASEVEAEQTGTSYGFRHTRNWRDKIEDAREVITGVRRDFRAYCQTATELLGIHISPSQADLFVSEFIPMPPDGLISQRVRTNVETARASMRRILRSATTLPVAHTAFGLVQAAGEYLDHVRRYRTAETRMNRSLLTTEPLKAKAVRLAREVANA